MQINLLEGDVLIIPGLNKMQRLDNSCVCVLELWKSNLYSSIICTKPLLFIFRFLIKKMLRHKLLFEKFIMQLLSYQVYLFLYRKKHIFRTAPR